MTQLTEESKAQQVTGPPAEQIASAAKAAMVMDALVGRLSYDTAFAADLANNPRDTLANAGLLMEKEDVEAFMAVNPERFDKMCEVLFGLVDSDFLINMGNPSCG